MHSKAIEFVQSITADEIDFISQADYGLDEARHKGALVQVIFKQNCIINTEQFWYPYEVVELTGCFCKEGHEREFAICNVLIALSIIDGVDRSNDANDMLDRIAPEYDKLPKDIRELVLNTLVAAEAEA